MADLATMPQPSSQRPAGALACEYCGGAALEPCHVRQVGSFWKCCGCGLLQMGTPLERDVLPWVDYATPMTRRMAVVTDIRLSRMATLVRTARPRLLDVADDHSPTLERADALGWLAMATLDNARAAASYRQRGFDVRHAPATILPFPTDYFDVVTAWFTLERVADARVALREWQRVLRPGGILAIEVHRSTILERAVARTAKAPAMRYVFPPPVLRGLARAMNFELMASPGLGRLELLGWRTAATSVWHQTRASLQSLVHRNRTFQLFCRRPLELRSALPKRGVA